ncbi:MAG: metal-sulfur cluster assembly factor [Gemmatimonadales bacterium]|jgi:metal-sulfur cluster biosynthetic enzyme|nr:MAG: metal-sulfur cluster assembly factor [Gemmatimonadales bacterium]
MPTVEVIRKALRSVRDPELNLNVVDLGLIYDIVLDEETNVRVVMTLTSPGCPAGEEITRDVRDTVQNLDGVGKVDVDIVWEPYWTPDRIDPRVRAFLGM